MRKLLFMIAILVLTSTIVGLIGYSDRELNPQEYIQFTKRAKNGLAAKKSVDDFVFEIDYLPLPVQALKEIKGSLNKSSYDKAMENYNGHHYFEMRIKKENREIDKALKSKLGSENYEPVMNRLRFGLQKEFNLYYGSKLLLPCVLYHLEQPFFREQGLKFIMVFHDPLNREDRKFEHDLTFHFNDKWITKQTIEFTLSREDLNRIPKLKF